MQRSPDGAAWGASSTTTAAAFSDFNLAPGTTYFYRVRATTAAPAQSAYAGLQVATDLASS